NRIVARADHAEGAHRALDVLQETLHSEMDGAEARIAALLSRDHVGLLPIVLVAHFEAQAERGTKQAVDATVQVEPAARHAVERVVAVLDDLRIADMDGAEPRALVRGARGRGSGCDIGQRQQDSYAVHHHLMDLPEVSQESRRVGCRRRTLVQTTGLRNGARTVRFALTKSGRGIDSLRRSPIRHSHRSALANTRASSPPDPPR